MVYISVIGGQMTKKFILAAAVYSVITMALGMAWHFVFFKDLYERLGIYNREKVIIPLGFASMIIQGIVLAYFYPLFYRGGSPMGQGVKFGLITGVFLFSVTTLATAAKIQVSSMTTWLLIQTAFHGIQFLLAGAGIGLVYGRLPRE